MGRAYLADGDPVQAEMLMEQALGRACEMGDRHSESKILSDLAHAMLSLDRRAAAVTSGERALALARALSDDAQALFVATSSRNNSL